MRIVSDSGMDLTPEQSDGLDITKAPLTIILNNVSYRSGEDIQPAQFYKMLSETDAFPTTSQPSAGDFADIYRRLAKTDPEILSIHISSGLSGTIQSARAGATMVPEAQVTFWDSKTLSCPLGWQVWAAACAVKAGWTKEKILALLGRISAATEGIFTIATIRYLVHGGRISHIKGLMASLLNIKPIIGVEKKGGTYVQLGQDITMKRAISRLADQVTRWYPAGTAMRFQVLHGNNREGAALLHERLVQMFDCTFWPDAVVAPVLGAHTGPALVGLALAPIEIFKEIP
ncbi:MAG: DegV family protein [Anaerolineaceae bacterium]|nr:DegV family protein [Anaerolineaceae bacterium]